MSAFARFELRIVKYVSCVNLAARMQYVHGNCGILASLFSVGHVCRRELVLHRLDKLGKQHHRISLHIKTRITALFSGLR